MIYQGPFQSLTLCVILCNLVPITNSLEQWKMISPTTTPSPSSSASSPWVAQENGGCDQSVTLCHLPLLHGHYLPLLQQGLPPTGCCLSWTDFMWVSHRQQVFKSYSSMGPYHGVHPSGQTAPRWVLHRSQLLPDLLILHGILSMGCSVENLQGDSLLQHGPWHRETSALELGAPPPLLLCCCRCLWDCFSLLFDVVVLFCLFVFSLTTLSSRCNHNWSLVYLYPAVSPFWSQLELLLL